MIVSDIENLMCFLAQTASIAGQNMLSTANFSTLISNTLKVHDSVFHAIDELQYESNALEATYLSVSFYDRDQADDGYGYSTPSSNVITDLASYSQEGFRKFFWSNKITETFFNDPNHASDTDFLSDKIRQQHWRKLAAEFADATQDSADRNDFCNIAAVLQNCEYSKGRVKIPLSPISNVEKRSDTAICFAYLVTMMASDDATIFLALQNP
jgi:hypothetical protein